MTRRVFLGFVAVMLLLTSSQVRAGIISSDTFNGHTYYLLDGDGVKWWDADEAEAVSLGGHLVTINDAAEDAFVFNRFGPDAVAYRNAFFPSAPSFVSLFIGFSDTASEGHFVWVSGSTSTYTNWIAGEPQNDTNQEYGGIAVNGFVPGGWHDIYYFPGSDFPLGVVEVDHLTSSVPEPSSLALLGLGGIGLAVAAYRRRRVTAAI